MYCLFLLIGDIIISIRADFLYSQNDSTRICSLHFLYILYTYSIHIHFFSTYSL